MIRFFDIVISILGLIILSPVLLIFMILIKIDSTGPVFFTQIRIGRGEKEFKLFKFRSMYLNSDIKELITIGNNDPRITRVGYIIRKYKIDEIPQFFNVLKGDMCLVGPRPEVKKYVSMYNEEQKKILSIKPGITDYASIVFRNENEIISNVLDPDNYYINILMPAKIKLNMKFIENYTIKSYFKIIFMTVVKVIKF